MFFRDSEVLPRSSSAWMTCDEDREEKCLLQSKTAHLQFRKTRMGPPPSQNRFIWLHLNQASLPALPALPPAAHRSVSSLAVECRYDGGLLGAAGLRDGGPHGSLLHVVVVVVVHVVAGGRRWGQPGRLMAGRRGGPEGAETRRGGGGRGRAGHGHL